MDHAHGGHESLHKTAVQATLHCLTGCAAGEILGLVIGTSLHWGNGETALFAIALAFLFGYSFTLVALARAGMSFASAARLALAADTLSIATMEIVDTGIILVIPGAMDAGLDTLLFWGSLAVSLLIAGIAAYPVNRFLIAKGKGHALVHAHHH